MHLLTVLLFFATCNHVLLQPLPKPGQKIPKTWPQKLPYRNLNIPLKAFHDNFYNKTIIPWIPASSKKLQGPCFSCLYYITPAMLQHRSSDQNILYNFNPKTLVVISKKNHEKVNYFDIGARDEADPYPGFVIPKATCSNEPAAHAQADRNAIVIARVKVENAAPISRLTAAFDVYHDKARNELLYVYNFNRNPELVGNIIRRKKMQQYTAERFMDVRGNNAKATDAYKNLKGGDFTFTYSITKAVKGQPNCELLLSLGSATKPIISEETLKYLPDGNKDKLYPKGFLSDFYTHDAYGSLQANRRPEFKGFRLKPNYIYIPLMPLLDRPELNLTFQFFEHPNPLYGATYTITTPRKCCLTFTISFFNDESIPVTLCDNKVEINREMFPTNPLYVFSNNWQEVLKASPKIKYRFFIPPISSDDIFDDYVYPETPQRVWNDTYNFVLYIIKEPSYNITPPRTLDHKLHPVYIHTKIKRKKRGGKRLLDPTNGDLVTVDIQNFREGCLQDVRWDEKETALTLEVEGPGILLKKPKISKKDELKKPTPTMRPQKGKYDVTRRVTESEPTFEPRTDPTYTEKTTTMKTSSASMPMGIVIGIMIALMIIILLWVYFADILCKKKSATNELLILEPPPRAKTPLPQSIEEVPPEIRLSADEPVSRPKKKANVEKKEPEPPVEKKRIPIPTPAPPHPGREASSEEPIPNTNGSLLSSIQKPMPDVPLPMPSLPPPTPAPQPPRTNFITCYEGPLYSMDERILTLSSAQSIWDVLPFTGGPDVPCEGYYFRIFDLTKSGGEAYKNFGFRLSDKIDMQDVPNWEIQRGVKIYILENDPAAFEIHTSGVEPPQWIPKLGGCQPCLKLSQNDDVPTVFTKSEVPKMNDTIKALPTCWHMFANYVSSDKANPDADDVTGVYVFRSTTDMVLSPAPKSCYHLHTVELKPLTGTALASWKEKLDDRIVSKVEKNVRVPEPSQVSLKYQNMSSSTSSSKKTKTNTDKTERTEKSEKTFAKTVPLSLLDKKRAVDAKLHTEKAKDSKKKAKDATKSEVLSIETKTETEDSTKKTKTETEEGSIKTEDDTQATPGATPPSDYKELAIPPLQGDSDRTIKPGGTAEVFAKPLSKKLLKKPVSDKKTKK
uniref:CUB domain-containing protein n=1 Tax=Panagrellus redivivus TaxID=6233 RepID=A0A7E4ZWG7_PANRE